MFHAAFVIVTGVSGIGKYGGGNGFSAVGSAELHK
jgi:hypothetical protein